MQLAAYHIINSDLGIKNQTVNFGGKYFYELSENAERKIEIQRTLNPKYISNFYSADEKLTLVSAIVGRNGTGKTRLLTEMIECISGSRRSSNILLFEEGEKVLLFFGNVDSEQGISGNTKREFINPDDFNIEVLRENIESIYYSPHLDHKDGVSGIDLSLDKIIYEDLEEAENLSRFTNPLNPMKQHEFNNFKRQASFILSAISKELYNQFNLPQPQEKLKISFSLVGSMFTDTSHTEFRFNNVPYDLRSALNDILKKCETEANSKRRGGDVHYQKERLKHYILWGILSIIVDVGERINTFLEEGKLPATYFDDVKNLTAIDTFFYFLKVHYFIYPTKSKNRKLKVTPNPIPRTETENLIKKLFTVIDNLKAKNARDTENFDWNHHCIYPSVEDVAELLTLETIFKENLKRYFQPAYGNKERITDVNSLIHPEWYNRNPSSGENAILNLFSRFYSAEIQINTSPIKYYLIFLDEGDAGFHPEWKKKYIEIVTSILPFLFSKKDAKFQIIFTTHDPLTLSDILNYNIVYLSEKVGDNSTILNFDDRPEKSFAANITDLLSDSFFIETGLIGAFSKKKIKEAVDWLNEKNNKVNAEYYQKLIENIDEPIVQRKLGEMYDEKMQTNVQKRIIEEQINQLKKIKDKLK